MVDVAMGSYIGAELFDLLSLFILHDLQQLLTHNSYDLYRDDGLEILNHHSTCDLVRTFKKIREVFNKNSFKRNIQNKISKFLWTAHIL